MTQLLFSPIRYYRGRLDRPPAWVVAFAGVAACAALEATSAYLWSDKMQPLVAAALPDQPLPSFGPYLALASSLVGYAAYFGIVILALLALNVLVGRPGPADRLTEFTALAFYTQIPYGLALVALMWVWEPSTALRLPPDSSPSEILDAVTRFRDTLQAESLPSTGRLLSYYSRVWLTAELSIALKVLAGLSNRAMAVIALSLALILFAADIFAFLIGVVG